MTGERAADAGRSRGSCCPVIELRRYTLHPGTRETLISLFDRELVEPQEAVGATVIAQFRDLDDPDVFTWIRGFPDMPSRAASLGAFYHGPVWAAHREAANATMVSSDDVRLLRPVRPGSDFAPGDRAEPDAAATPPGLVVATVYTLDASTAADFPAFFDRELAPRLAAAGVTPLALLETEPSVNTFPRLPVREGEHAFAWFARFDDPAAHDRHAAALAGGRRWTGALRRSLERRLAAPPEVWRLTPTARSRMLG
jgi:NIPSNAP